MHCNEHIEYNRTLFYGEGLFETLLYKGQTKRLRRHHRRLEASAHALSMMCPSYEEFAGHIERAAQSERDLYIKYCLFSEGENLFYKGASSYKGIVIKGTLPKPQEFARLTISPYSRSSHNPVIYHKSTNYLFNILSKRDALSKGYDDGIILNENGYVTECSSSNLILKTKAGYITPSKASGLLWGVTLSILSDNLPIRQANVTLETLKEVESVFILNSLIGVVPVITIDSKEFFVNMKEKMILQEILQGEDICVA